MKSGNAVDSLRHVKFDGYPQILKESEEFKKTEYQLKINCGNNDIIAKRIWNVTTPKISKKYEDFKSENNYFLEQFSILLTEDLDDINSIEKVLDRGFVIQPPGGLLFPCGFFP
jgi:hypothetical protein